MNTPTHQSLMTLDYVIELLSHCRADDIAEDLGLLRAPAAMTCAQQAEMENLISECAKALDCLLKQKPMMGAFDYGLGTLGNLRSELNGAARIVGRR